MNQIKGVEIDRLVKNKIEVLNISAPPMAHWDRAKTWQVIKCKLQGTNKTIIAWGVSIAASVSLLVAAGLNIDPSIFFDLSNESKQKVQSQIINIQPEDHFEHTQPSPRKAITMENLQSKYVRTHKVSPALELPVVLGNSFYQPTGNYTMTKKNNRNLISPYFSINSGVAGTIPTVGLNFSLLSNRQNTIIHEINLGASTSFQIINTENMRKIHPLTFINIEYSRIDENKNNGWSARAGYMINPDSNVYKNQTIKFSVNKRFNNHIKAGPEIIFTDNFRKAYPGISIVLS